MKTEPERIFLQIEQTWGERRTWREDRINDSDVEYIRADLAPSDTLTAEQFEHSPERITELRKSYDDGIARTGGWHLTLEDGAFLFSEIERLQAESRTAREEACEIVERVALECAKEFAGTSRNCTYSALDIVEMFGQVASRTMFAIRELKHKETTNGHHERR